LLKAIRQFLGLSLTLFAIHVSPQAQEAASHGSVHLKWEQDHQRAMDGTTVLPLIETPLIDGDLAFRQHKGGHTTGPNWPTFLAFAERYIR